MINSKHFTPYPFIVVGTVLALIIFGTYQVDDTAIYARIIQNWFSTGIATFNHRDPNFPVTSNLWFFIGSTLYSLFRPESIYDLLRIASFLITISSWYLYARLASREMKNETIMWGTFLLLLTDELVMENGLSGMDTSLAVLTSILALYYFRDKPLFSGAACGLSYATRPEGMFIILARLFLFLLRRQYKNLVISLLGIALTSLPVIIGASLIAPDSVSTIAAKSSSFTPFLKLIPNLMRLTLILGSVMCVPIIILSFTCWQNRHSSFKNHFHTLVKDDLFIFATLIIIMTLGAYTVLLNDDFLKGRYVAPLMPFIYIVIGITISTVLENKEGYLFRYAPIGNLLLLATVGVANVKENYDTYLGRVKGAALINKYRESEGDSIGIGSIGVIALKSDIDILDNHALATPLAKKPLSKEKCEELLRLYPLTFILRTNKDTGTPLPIIEGVPYICFNLTAKLLESFLHEVHGSGYLPFAKKRTERISLYRILKMELK